MKEAEELKQFLAQKAFDKWAKENQLFIRDLRNLLEEMVMFEAMHGVQIRPGFKPFTKPKDETSACNPN